MVVGSTRLAIDKPVSISIILPANVTIELHIDTENPMKSPVNASLATITAYPKTVSYGNGALSGMTPYNRTATKKDNPIFT